jgi:hypothetical protein
MASLKGKYKKFPIAFLSFLIFNFIISLHSAITIPEIPPYSNFPTIIKLFSQYQKFYREYYTNTKKFIENEKNFDLLKKTIRLLRKERECYNRYMLEIKHEYRSSLTAKKQKSLKYYQTALINAIRELENIAKVFVDNSEIIHLEKQPISYIQFTLKSTEMIRDMLDDLKKISRSLSYVKIQ